MMPPGLSVRLLNCLRTKPCTIYVLNERGFHISQRLCLDQDWREQKGLAANPNAFGILTNGADYSYKDGRPTPYGSGQRKRIDAQREYAARMIQLSKEIDGAVERHAKLEMEKKAAAQKLLDDRLKPKGKLYKPLYKADDLMNKIEKSEK